MTLATGTKLGPYEILAPLGAGGMGEVYRARDTRLGREVAIKLLPVELAKDPERVARFEREARSASALSHAHVVSVFDIGRSGEISYIVSEIVAGGNLRDLLDRGPLPLRRALDLAVQIASGLAEAHESGIVHRDLKPENILLTRSGEAKIADFGLAKLAETGSAGMSQLPTSDGLKTSDGIVMGTVSYMSPEQAGGRSVDFRSDQFAFGSILYEMLAGKSPFRRPTAGETMAAVMRDEPQPVRAIISSVPPQLGWILDRCLAKESDARYASTRDLARELMLVREHLSEMTSGSADAVRQPSTLKVRRSLLPWFLTALALAAAAAMAFALLGRRRSALRPTIRFAVAPPTGGMFLSTFDLVSLAFSPDGSRLAFVLNESRSPRQIAENSRPSRRVWVRTLSDLEAHPLAGSDGASSIFWSPDGRSIGFFTGGQLKRIDIAGGSAVPICDLPGGLGGGVTGTWGAGDILFDSTFDGLIYRVSADGGRPAVLVRPDPARGEMKTRWPWFLPDGRTFLYLAARKDGENDLLIGSHGQPSRVVAPISSRVEYVDPGFLVFARDGALVAQRFDPASGRLSGPLLSLAPAVRYFYSNKWAAFATSRNGMLAYSGQGNVSRLSWFDRSGRLLGKIGSEGAGDTINVAISPDGHSVLFDRTRPDLGTFDIWMIDLARGVETRVTSEPDTEFDPVWLPDGKHLVYSVVRHGQTPQIVRRELAGGPEDPLLPPGSFQEAMAVSRDGRRLLFSQRPAAGTFGVWTLSLAGDPVPAPLVTSKSQQETARFSPDDGFVAFISDESGQPEAYVEALAPDRQRVRISTGGATLLRWSRDGKEIFYASPDGKLYAVPIRVSPALQVGAPAVLFSLPAEGWEAFDVASDGRFLAAIQEVSATTVPLSVVSNWTSEIRP